LRKYNTNIYANEYKFMMIYLLRYFAEKKDKEKIMKERCASGKLDKMHYWKIYQAT